MSNGFHPESNGDHDSKAAAQAAANGPINLACGHDVDQPDPVVIMPSRKVRFDCPNGCGLQPAA